jgi:uncharacterized protein (TIGR04562 family)
MEKPNYLSKYVFDWELLNIVLSGKSPLDAPNFIGSLTNREQVTSFLQGYGMNPDDPVSQAELFGNFQESIQFIRRYFLKEGDPEIGLDLEIPSDILSITNITDLFLLAAMKKGGRSGENRLWAEAILKVMHTILHVDKDIRKNYFAAIQTQIFDRFYKHIRRDSDNHLYIGDKESGDFIQLVDFETKSQKSRDSIIIKLLHKVENVAEELFDRIGIRFITENKFDVVKLLKFLIEKSLIIPHNVKPSRSVNKLLDINGFQQKYRSLLRVAMKNNLSEERFVQALGREAADCIPKFEEESHNIHSFKDYRSLQFTCRQLITYTNPFLYEFNELKKQAKDCFEKEENREEKNLANKILSMDTSLIAKDIRFFYPFEVQIIDQKTHKENSVGKASHQKYKKAQLISARDRVFKNLMKKKGIMS